MDFHGAGQTLARQPKVLNAVGMPPCAEGEPSASGSLLAQPQLVEATEATLLKSHRTA